MVSNFIPLSKYIETETESVLQIKIPLPEISNFRVVVDRYVFPKKKSHGKQKRLTPKKEG